MNGKEYPEKIWLSIIVPVFNTKKEAIKRCMASIAKTGIPLEVLLVDDGSEKETRLFCQKLKKVDDRIRYFRKENGGVSSARNYGIEAARGNYILFLDADDELSENFFDSLEDLQFYTDDWVLFDTDILNQENGQVTRRRIFSDGEEPGNVQVMEKILGCSDLNECWGKLIRRDFLSDYNIFFPVGVIQGEDTIFNIKIACCARRIGYSSRCSYRYYMELRKHHMRVAKDLTKTKKASDLYSDLVSDFIEEKCPYRRKRGLKKLLCKKILCTMGSTLVILYRSRTMQKEEKVLFIRWWEETKNRFPIEAAAFRFSRTGIYAALFNTHFWFGFRVLAVIRNSRE